jgi:hypothetical protein
MSDTFLTDDEMVLMQPLHADKPFWPLLSSALDIDSCWFESCTLSGAS